MEKKVCLCLFLCVFSYKRGTMDQSVDRRVFPIITQSYKVGLEIYVTWGLTKVCEDVKSPDSERNEGLDYMVSLINVSI